MTLLQTVQGVAEFDMTERLITQGRKTKKKTTIKKNYYLNENLQGSTYTVDLCLDACNNLTLIGTDREILSGVVALGFTLTNSEE